MGVKVPIDVLGAVASVGVLAAGAGYAAGKIGEAIAPQTKTQKMQADAEAMIRNSGVKPVYLKP